MKILLLICVLKHVVLLNYVVLLKCVLFYIQTIISLTLHKK